MTSLFHWTRNDDLEALPDSLSIDAVKAHLRISHDLEDQQIALYTKAAAYLAMDYANRPLIPIKFKMRTADTPKEVELPVGTTSVVSAIYMDVDSQMQNYDASVWYVVAGNPPVMHFKSTAPPTRGQFDDVAIEVVAGYGRVPENVAVAILLIAGSLYENRESDSPITLYDVPVAKLLLDTVRIPGVA
jgi:uncharacterized phiE125 gp8 family phage protein